jgi:hypothetical protein
MQAKDWREQNRWMADLLQRSTGDNLAVWNSRVRETGIGDEANLRAWLSEQGVTGYPQMLLVMERFGYPDFLLASADELIDGQYHDRPELRPILDAVLAMVMTIGEVTIQARKTYVSLLTPKRTFATVQATTRRRVDLGLRLSNQEPSGRLLRATSMGSGSVTMRIPLVSPEEVDGEVETWLRRAYEENS